MGEHEVCVQKEVTSAVRMAGVGPKAQSLVFIIHSFFSSFIHAFCFISKNFKLDLNNCIMKRIN